MVLNFARAKSVMERYDLDAIIAGHPTNVVYISDFASNAHMDFGDELYILLPREDQ
jgi:hypothetical protein